MRESSEMAWKSVSSMIKYEWYKYNWWNMPKFNYFGLLGHGKEAPQWWPEYITFSLRQGPLPSIGELASSPTTGHDLHVVYMQILIG